MPLTEQQEREIYPLLDQVLELPFGKAVLRRCTPGRADYLARHIKGFIWESAIESMQMYEPGHPLYGKGSYATIWAEAHEQGLLVTRLQHLPNVLGWQLIQVAATKEPYYFAPTPIGRVRQVLIRMQRKYPDIMGQVWVDAESLSIYYGEKATDTVIVDIDVEGELSVTAEAAQQARLRNLKDPNND